MSDKKTPKLHELLAVEQEKKGTADHQRAATIETFRKKQSVQEAVRPAARPDPGVTPSIL